MFFRKKPKRIGLELGEVIFSEPIIDTLWAKAKKKKYEKEMHSIIAFARLVSIKHFFPIAKRYIEPWNTISSTIDDYYFESLDRNRSHQTFPIGKMGTDEEAYIVCYHLDIPYTLNMSENTTGTDFNTFIGSAVTTRYNRYIELLDLGFKSTGNNIKDIQCYSDLSEAVACDLEFLFTADAEEEVIGSIAPAAMHGLSILLNHGLYD